MGAQVTSPANDVAFSDLRTGSGDDFDAMVAIYTEALPTREQKSASAIRAMCGSANYRVVVAKAADAVVGFFILFVGQNMSLLEYMAVAKATRGRGYGASLYRRARRDAGPNTPLLLEVDSDREPSADRALRTRRKDFYRRLGCRVIEGLDYVLPLPGQGRAPVMDLLVDSGELTDSVPKPLVTSWLREIYTHVYACADDDARLLKMIASLAPHSRLT